MKRAIVMVFVLAFVAILATAGESRSCAKQDSADYPCGDQIGHEQGEY